MRDWNVIIGEKERQKATEREIKLSLLVIEVAVATFLIGYVLGLGEVI